MAHGTNIDNSEYYGDLQAVVENLFHGLSEDDTITRLQAVLSAEAADLPDDLTRIVNLLPPGDYTRERLTTQLNSAITGHAWGQVYGTVS